MSERPLLNKPKFIKVIDLERLGSGYNVIVQIIETNEKVVETRQNEKIKMINCVVGDETGSVDAFFKGDNTEFIKVGNVVAIRNGVKKIIKGHICLEIDIFGRVTLQKAKIPKINDENISDKKVEAKNRQSSRRFKKDNFEKKQKKNNSSFNAQKQNPKYEEKKKFNGEKRNGDKKKEPRYPLKRINEINPGEQDFNLLAKVISVTMASGKNSRQKCILGDETGTVNAFLPKTKILQAGQTIFLYRAEARVIKEHIQIDIPVMGSIELGRTLIKKVDNKFNLSQKSWIPVN